jgi:hypothetical protein
MIMEGLVEFGDKVRKGGAVPVENAALVPDYCLRKSVAFYGRRLVFELGVVGRGRVYRSWSLHSISKALEGA